VTPEARTPVAQPPASARARGSLRFAAGLFVAGVLIAAAVVALTSGGSSPTKQPPVRVKLPALTEKFTDRALGVTGLATRRWVIGGVGPILHLTSIDRKALIAIGSPGAARTAHGALHVAIATIRNTYRKVTLKQAPGSTLAGRPAFSVVMYGTNVRGARIRILVATAEGVRLAYVMQAFTAVNAPLRDLEEAQQIIATLRFSN
jgi:hypothetical protein